MGKVNKGDVTSRLIHEGDSVELEDEVEGFQRELLQSNSLNLYSPSSRGCRGSRPPLDRETSRA